MHYLITKTACFFFFVKVHASKALVEAVKGRDALGVRVAQLLAGDDVDQLAAAGKRLYGKLSDRDSVIGARARGISPHFYTHTRDDVHIHSAGL